MEIQNLLQKNFKIKKESLWSSVLNEIHQELLLRNFKVGGKSPTIKYLAYKFAHLSKEPQTIITLHLEALKAENYPRYLFGKIK